MQQPPAQPTWRLIDWILVPLYRPEYRRLLWWSFTLTLRMHMLSLMVNLIAPVATPAMVRLLRRWFENLRVEAAAFRRAVRAPRSHPVLQADRVGAAARPLPPEPAAAPAYENPAYENPWA